MPPGTNPLSPIQSQTYTSSSRRRGQADCHGCPHTTHSQTDMTITTIIATTLLAIATTAITMTTMTTATTINPTNVPHWTPAITVAIDFSLFFVQ
uniref:Uncharacterized protein n=1 Tax=Romanomermis culicivorax TaxID=13658 RepID=A0A915KJ08_ROMCU